MKTGFFVYILRPESDPPHFYTGFTENLDARLAHHHSGGEPHTAKYRPWRIKTSVAFTDREQALAFELLFWGQVFIFLHFAREDHQAVRTCNGCEL